MSALTDKLKKQAKALIPRFYREYKGASDWWYPVRVGGKDYDLNFLTHDPDGTGEFPAKLRNAVKVVAYIDGIDGKFIRLGYFNGRYKMGNRMYKDRRAIEENPVAPSGYHYMPDGRLMADSEHSVSTNPRGIDPNLAYKKEYGWTFVEFLKKRLIPDLRESGMYATIADYQRGISLYNDKKGVLPSTQYLNYLKYLRETLIPDLKESGSESTAADFERMYKMVLYTWNNQPKIRKTKYRRDLDDR